MMDNWDMKNTDSGPYSPFAEDAPEVKYTKEIRCEHRDCPLDHCEHMFHVGENWLVCKKCEEKAALPDIRCAACTNPAGYCECCDKCGKTQPLWRNAKPGEVVCECKCQGCQRSVWDGLCDCCPHGVDTSKNDANCKECEQEFHNHIQSGFCDIGPAHRYI